MLSLWLKVLESIKEVSPSELFVQLSWEDKAKSRLRRQQYFSIVILYETYVRNEVVLCVNVWVDGIVVLC